MRTPTFLRVMIRLCRRRLLHGFGCRPSATSERYNDGCGDANSVRDPAASYSCLGYMSDEDSYIPDHARRYFVLDFERESKYTNMTFQT